MTASDTTLPAFDDVLAAAARIAAHAHVTQYWCRARLTTRGARLLFKGKHLQRIGAFKFPRACNAVWMLDAASAAPRVVTHFVRQPRRGAGAGRRGVASLPRGGARGRGAAKLPRSRITVPRCTLRPHHRRARSHVHATGSGHRRQRGPSVCRCARHRRPGHGRTGIADRASGPGALVVPVGGGAWPRAPPWRCGPWRRAAGCTGRAHRRRRRRALLRTRGAGPRHGSRHDLRWPGAAPWAQSISRSCMARMRSADRHRRQTTPPCACCCRAPSNWWNRPPPPCWRRCWRTAALQGRKVGCCCRVAMSTSMRCPPCSRSRRRRLKSAPARPRSMRARSWEPGRRRRATENGLPRVAWRCVPRPRRLRCSSRGAAT